MKPSPLLVITVALMLIANGCPSRQARSPNVVAEKASPMLQVESFTLSEKEARLAYRVDNPFDHDIWVCEDMDGRGSSDARQNAETQVEEKTLWIRVRFNLESSLHTYAAVFARYCRLGPGESSSRTIVLSLPVQSISPIRKFYGRAVPVSAERVILEVGYLTGDLPSMLSETQATTSRRPTNDPNAAYVRFRWQRLAREQVAEATIANVTVPCVVRIPSKAQ
jgi:hypothetical protein